MRRLTPLHIIIPVESIKAPSSVTAFERLLSFKALDLRAGGRLTGAFCGLWVSVAAGRLTGAEDAGTGLRKRWAGAGPEAGQRVRGTQGLQWHSPARPGPGHGSHILEGGEQGEDRAFPHEKTRAEGLGALARDTWSPTLHWASS